MPGQLVLRDRDTDGNGVLDEPGTSAMQIVSVSTSGEPGNAESATGEARRQPAAVNVTLAEGARPPRPGDVCALEYVAGRGVRAIPWMPGHASDAGRPYVPPDSPTPLI